MAVYKESRVKPGDFSVGALLQHKKKSQAPYSLKPQSTRPTDNIIAHPIAAETVHQAKGDSEQLSARDQEVIAWFENYYKKLSEQVQGIPRYMRMKNCIKNNCVNKLLLEEIVQLKRAIDAGIQAALDRKNNSFHRDLDEYLLKFFGR